MKNNFLFTGIMMAVFIWLAAMACSRNPYRATNRSYRKQSRTFAKTLRERPGSLDSVPPAPYWAGTTNFSMRRPNYVIIHHTAQNSCQQTLRTFTLPRTQVSAHYVICRDGTVFHMLNDYLRAHQAGVSRWGNTTDLNSSSIGIELDNTGFEYFTEPQIHSLLRLLARLKKAYSIPTANFIGHGDIAPTRKNDPNWRFPWKELADSGFGYWYADTTGLQLPAAFDPMQSLRIIGFDMKDSSAAILAFKRHWLQDTTRGLDSPSCKVLYRLALQYR